ncbi:MAG TPA: radical SAM protein [Candidatus Diapherotrites archaeon]|uniref:Radical SAM protein n=1 Tax=Candidatus Iainarchaeum sp. TaxID=3101447 RepID=A0A7J4JHB7_9ARCH|nr:radical SAM protein [Candidatus Diapherotrites archaeon]
MLRKVLRFWRDALLDILDGDAHKVLHRFAADVYRARYGGPNKLHIEPIAACNLHCEFCSIPPPLIKRESRFMSLEKFKKIVDDVKPHCVVMALYLGGESLLHPQLPEMVAYASKQGIYTELSTNATLLTPEVSRKLIQGGLDSITLSIDGASKASVEGMRLGSNYENLMHNLREFFRIKRELGKRKPDASFQLLVSKLNKDEIADFEAMAKGFGGHTRIRTLGLPTWVGEGVDLKALADKYILGPEEAAPFAGYEIDREGPCTFDRRSVVFADGRVVPCCFDIHGAHVMGNAYLKPFHEIWSGKTYQQTLPLVRAKQLDICEGCDLNPKRSDAKIKAQYSSQASP